MEKNWFPGWLFRGFGRRTNRKPGSGVDRKVSTGSQNSGWPFFEEQTGRRGSTDEEPNRKVSIGSQTSDQPLLLTGRKWSRDEEFSRKISTGSQSSDQPLFDGRKWSREEEPNRKVSTSSQSSDQPLLNGRKWSREEEPNRKVSTDSQTSGQPLFEVQAGQRWSRNEEKISEGNIGSSGATRKDSASSLQPLVVIYETEPIRRISSGILPGLPEISNSVVEDTVLSEESYKDNYVRENKKPAVVTIDTVFSSSAEARKWMYKNLIGMGLSFLFVFSAFIGLQNLQSTINAEEGLGLATLAVVYLFFTLSGFVTPGLIRLFGTKYCLLGGFLCHLIYNIANFYPRWYTLVPASALIGLGSGPIWAASNAHLVKVAVSSATWLEIDQDLLISFMVGIFFSFFQGSQIPGNLASSLIYFPYSNNETHLYSVDAEVMYPNNSVLHCSMSEDQNLDSVHLYILLSVYFVMINIGLLALILMVSHLPIERDKDRNLKRTLIVYFGKPIIDLLRFMKNWQVLLIIPLAIVNGLEQAFVFGTVAQVVIADCFGTYLVGFAFVEFGITSAITGILLGRLVKYIPRYFLFVFGGLINIGVLIFLLMWKPRPSYVVVFMVAFFWAVADSIWNTMTTRAYWRYRILLLVVFVMSVEEVEQAK